jgi:hypothetical protein
VLTRSYNSIRNSVRLGAGASAASAFMAVLLAVVLAIGCLTCPDLHPTFAMAQQGQAENHPPAENHPYAENHQCCPAHDPHSQHSDGKQSPDAAQCQAPVSDVSISSVNVALDLTSTSHLSSEALVDPTPVVLASVPAFSGAALHPPPDRLALLHTLLI